MKKKLLVVLAGTAFLANSGIFAKDYSSVTILNRSKYPFTISEVKEIRGDKVVPTYAPRVPYVGPDLVIPGFRSYFRLTNWVCIREGRRQVVQNSLRTRTKRKNITINPGRSKKIFNVDREQPSLAYVRWWVKEGVKDPEFVPAKLRKALSRVYPFEAKRVKLEGAGGTVEFNVQSERAGLLDALEVALVTGIGAGAAAGVVGLALPGGLLIGPLHLAPAAAITAAVAAGIKMDQSSFLTWKYDAKGMDVKVRFIQTGLGNYRNLKIIIDSVIPKKDIYEREWYEGESGEVERKDPYITR